MLIGREFEQAVLQNLLDKEDSQFVVVYGRRRVGKTYLIRETFNYTFTFQHTGLAQTDKKGQLSAFKDSLSVYGLKTKRTPMTWNEAFGLLKKLIDNAPSGKKVIFIDELPWMDTAKSNLIAALENFWNGWVTARPQKDVVLIVCGSATSWITTNLLKNKKGLRGRLTDKIYLKPFTLSECEKYSQASGLCYTRKDIVETYMILGGIPYYWSFLKRGMSVPQNIDQLFFSENAKLADEFGALYATLFKRPEKYIKVIEVLSRKKTGLSRGEMIALTKLPDGGTFSAILDELQECGFIRYYVPFGRDNNGGLYQLIDNFTLFHYHCIKKNAYGDDQYWTHTFLSNEHNVWAGLAFERVCLEHVQKLKIALGISGILTNICSWRHEASDEYPGAQIDLVFKRADNVIDLFEIKYGRDEFVINSDYASKMRNKVSVFRAVTKTKSAVHTILVATYGIKRNEYSNGFQGILTMDCLF